MVMSMKNRRPATSSPLQIPAAPESAVAELAPPPVETPRGPGRPPGSRNETLPTTIIERPQCPKCGSTERSKYIGSPLIQRYGHVYKGQVFSQVVKRHCNCAKCGQRRIEVEHL
jgi:ribosomal protein S27AE